MEQSPSLRNFRLDRQIRDLEVRNAYSVFLPALDLTSTLGLADGRPPVETSPWTSGLDLTLSENLYDNGISVTAYSSAKFRRAIAELNFEFQRDQILLNVSLEYMRYSLAKSLLSAQERQFSIVNAQFKSVDGLYRQGVKTRRDDLKFKTELRRAEIEVQTATAAVERSRIELMRLIGFDNKDQPPFDFVPLDTSTAVDSVPVSAPDIAEHYQYRIADLQKRILENDVRLVKREDDPQLFLTAGANYHRGDYLNLTSLYGAADQTTWNALLNLRFNLWDWGIRRRNISIAEAKKSQGENGLAADLQSFAAENAKLMIDLNLSAKNYAVARELLELESRSYGYLDADYRNGKVSYLEVVIGLRDLLNAKVQVDTSYFDLRGQLLKYRYFEGRLYDSLFEK